ncbi:hypothetical protein [Mangrovibacterium lignilyticum]|uniref:hypothetical protein n=1 Tax=Mangrovibacterium lignilyticum TaxID=2668052 RepID=UPI0013CFF05E|nr:hypothetical protein [Mangrovibacterium lignilyticum]
MITLSAFTRKLLIRLLFLGIILTGTLSGFSIQKSDQIVTPASEEGEAPASPVPKNYHPSYTFWNRYVGELYLSGGYSTDFKYGSALGGKMVLDYMVEDQLSIGAQSGLYQMKKDEGKYLSSYLGIRVSYHLIRAKLHRKQNPWNVYTGVSCEVAIGPGEKDWHEKKFLGDIHFGARYRLNEKWFMWAEAAVNNLSVGLTLAL